MENPFEILDQKLNKIITLMEQRSAIKEPEKVPAEKDIMNIQEAASYLDCSRRTIYGYTSTRTIPHLKINHRVMFRKKDLVEWISDKRVKTRWEIQEEANNYLVRKKNRSRK